jgi:hypothetical protein
MGLGNFFSDLRGSLSGLNDIATAIPVAGSALKKGEDTVGSSLGNIDKSMNKNFGSESRTGTPQAEGAAPAVNQAQDQNNEGSLSNLTNLQKSANKNKEETAAAENVGEGSAAEEAAATAGEAEGAEELALLL